jgi:hypothetical protein
MAAAERESPANDGARLSSTYSTPKRLMNIYGPVISQTLESVLRNIEIAIFLYYRILPLLPNKAGTGFGSNTASCNGRLQLSAQRFVSWHATCPCSS